MADSEEKLCSLVSEFGTLCERRKLRVNVGKSKGMRCSRYVNGGSNVCATKWRTIRKVKGKVVYGQEPPSGESTTTECGFNYHLLAVITEAAQWETPSCSQPQSDTDNGVRDGRSN